MYCKYCGKEIADDSQFCPYCGRDLSNRVNHDPYSSDHQHQKYIDNFDTWQIISIIGSILMALSTVLPFYTISSSAGFFYTAESYRLAGTALGFVFIIIAVLAFIASLRKRIDLVLISTICSIAIAIYITIRLSSYSTFTAPVKSVGFYAMMASVILLLASVIIGQLNANRKGHD